MMTADGRPDTDADADTGTKPQGSKRFGDTRLTCKAAQEEDKQNKMHPPHFCLSKDFHPVSIIQTVPRAEKAHCV